MKKILLMMFLSLMSLNVFAQIPGGGLPPLKRCNPECVLDDQICNSGTGVCDCINEKVKMNDGTCDFLGDTFTEEYYPTITEPGIYTGYLDDKYTNAYKSSCASGITTINPATGKPYPVETGKDRIYHLYLTIPQKVTLKLKGVSNPNQYGLITFKNPVLSILKASNKQVLACNDNVSKYDKTSELLERELSAGLYYIVVDGVNTTDYGNYELDITFKASCKNISCNGFGTCGINENSIAECNCNPGYTKPSYSDLTCVSVCGLLNCPSNSACIVNGNQGYCDCNVGYYMTNGLCVDNCSYYTCGTNGACIHNQEDSDEAECICNDGYSIYPQIQTLCTRNDYWGGSLDTKMGSNSYTSGLRNNRYNGWIGVMSYERETETEAQLLTCNSSSMEEYYTCLGTNNILKGVNSGLSLEDPDEHGIDYLELINNIFNNVIWFNVTHGADGEASIRLEWNHVCDDPNYVAYSDDDCYDRYLEPDSYRNSFMFGGSSGYYVYYFLIKSQEIDKEYRLTWFTTTACNSGNNHKMTINNKIYYSIWVSTAINLLSSNTVKNPNGYFGTDGKFSNWETTIEQGEDFADEYLNNKSHLKYSWNYSYEDWWIRNDSRIVYTGKDKSDCFGRMGKDYYNPDTSKDHHRQSRLPQSEIKNYCYRLYYNNWDEDTYKGNGEIEGIPESY